jgi:hypothetical protein
MRYQGAHQRRQRIEAFVGVALAFLADQMRVGQNERVVLLQRALDQQRDGALRCVQAGVGIDAAYA